jgi:small-conductance mechanosensitive channel
MTSEFGRAPSYTGSNYLSKLDSNPNTTQMKERTYTMMPSSLKQESSNQTVQRKTELSKAGMQYDDHEEKKLKKDRSSNMMLSNLEEKLATLENRVKEQFYLIRDKKKGVEVHV